MSYGIVLVFDGVGADQYCAVNDRLGIGRDGSGDWPAGLAVHTGGPTETGCVVSEVWASKGDHEAFLAGRLARRWPTPACPRPSRSSTATWRTSSHQDADERGSISPAGRKGPEVPAFGDARAPRLEACITRDGGCDTPNQRARWHPMVAS